MARAKQAVGWVLVAVAVIALAGFSVVAALGFAAMRDAGRAEQAAEAAGRVKALEGVARDAVSALVRADADGAVIDIAAISEAVGRLGAGVGAALVAEAAAQRLEPAAIETLARLASESRDLAALADRLASSDGDASGALVERLSLQADALGGLGAALAAQGAAEPPGAPWLALAAAGCSALLVALSVRALRTPAPVVAAPADAERPTDAEARARFVAMMNHELRTPMNGVIGLISVLKEGAFAPDQVRMLEEAERAGRQMATMLDDMLEQEMARDGAAEPGEPPPFKVEALAQSLRDLYAPAAARAGVGFRVDCVGEMPPRATGDGRRFFRAISHLCGYVLEKAGARDVQVEIRHDGDECRAALSFDFAKGQGEALKLKELVETGAKSEAELTEAGLGPLLAKGLLERMGGRLEVTTTDSGRVLVLAATPSKATEEVSPRVRIMAQTRSLGALGAAAASAAGVEVLSADDAPAPDIVLIEAGGPEEAATIDEARNAWPRAAVIALGDPAAPALFDAIIPPPLEPDRVAEVVETTWERRRGGGGVFTPSPVSGFGAAAS